MLPSRSQDEFVYDLCPCPRVYRAVHTLHNRSGQLEELSFASKGIDERADVVTGPRLMADCV